MMRPQEPVDEPANTNQAAFGVEQKSDYEVKDGSGGYTFEQAIEHLGFGPFQWLMMILCGLGWFAAITELVIVSFAAPAIQEYFGLSQRAYGVLGSSSFMGMILGNIFWGYITDRFGRKISFTCTIWITFVFSLVAAFSPNFAVLLVFRILAASGIGGMLPNVYCQFVEFQPIKRRGSSIVVVDAIGVIPALLVSSGVSYGFSGSNLSQWRYILGVSSVPAGIFGFLRLFIPESPRYYLQKDRIEDAEKVLQRMAKANKKQLPPGNLLPLMGEVENHNPFGKLYKLFEGPVMKATTWRLWLMSFLAQFASGGAVFALPAMLQEAFDLDGRELSLILLYGVIGLIPFLILAGFVAEWSRKYSLTIYFVGCGFSVILLALSLLSPLKSKAFAIVASFLLRGTMESIFALLNCFRCESYPTSTRAFGMGMSLAFNDIGGIVAPIVFGVLNTSTTLEAVALSLFAFGYLLAAFPTATLPVSFEGKPVYDRHAQLLAESHQDLEK